jgi:peptidyl-prolyl cis-trans isomerase D
MMQVFRSMAGKVAAAIFAVLMLIFLWTSVDWSQVRGGSRTNVGEINGVGIPLRNYQQMVQNEVENQQRRNGHSLTAEETEEVRNNVWDEIIQQQSLEQEYRKRGIDATADEIATAISDSPLPDFLSRPEFQTDGKFDIAKYQRWLRSSAAAQYVPLLEVQYADQIRQSKLLRVVTGDTYISDAALWEAWKDANETTTIEMVTINPASAVHDSSVSVSDAEVQAYFQAHKDDFKLPASAFLSYVEVLRTTNASDTAAARQRALDLRKEIVAGTPFSEVAKRESADSVSAKSGGALSEFGKGSLDPAFERAAFSLPVGTISEPVLSAFGYHLIQVDKRAGGKVTAHHILIPIEIVGRHRDALDARADSLELLGAEKSDPAALDTAASALGLKIGSANPLQSGSRVQIGMQVVPDAGLWAFQAKPGETSRIIEVSYAYFLFRLDSVHAEGVPPFEQVRGAVEQAAKSAKKFEAARSIGEDLLKRVGEGSTLAQAASALRLPHQELAPFTRNNPPLPSPRVVGAAFGVEVGKTSGVIQTDEGYYLIRVIKRTPPDREEYLKKVEEFRAHQLQLARQNRVREYLAALKESAKVEDNRASIYRTEAQSQQTQNRS